MCGIIGIVGSFSVAYQLVNGLKRMECRCYDSAGICALHEGVLVRRRAEGRLANPVTVLAGNPTLDNIGIAYTRWTTHGAPAAANAHSHAIGEVAIVRNEIIVNFKDVRAEFAAKGREVLPRLLCPSAQASAFRSDPEPADRRTLGIAAGTELRPGARRCRNVSRFRHARARAAEPAHRLSGRRRLGGDPLTARRFTIDGTTP